MSEQSGPAVGQEAASPFPARYGSVRGPVEDVALNEAPRAAPARGGYEQTGSWAPADEAGGRTQAIPVADGTVPVRRLIRHVDVWTVFKVSLVFYVLFGLIVLVAGVVAWIVGVNLHFVRDIERAVRTLADKRKFVLHPLPVLEYAAAAIGVLALLGTVVNTVAAVLYNLISDLVGGIQTVEVLQED